MAKTGKKKIKYSNIIIVGLIVLLIIPQTRIPIQTALPQLMAKILSISIEDSPKQVSFETWVLKGTDGTQISFLDLKNKVVVINFWATWCPPCLAEMSSLNDLYNEFKTNEDIIFLYVSHEESQVLQDFIQTKGYQFEPFMPQNGIPSDLTYDTIPRTFIIDKNGNKVVDVSMAADWNSEKIHKLLKELTAF